MIVTELIEQIFSNGVEEWNINEWTKVFKGSNCWFLNPCGFALKFYTEDGNYDLIGNNTPVFFIRDPLKFPDFIHTQKRNPATNCKDPDMFWDLFSLTPESIH